MPPHDFEIKFPPKATPAELKAMRDATAKGLDQCYKEKHRERRQEILDILANYAERIGYEGEPNAADVLRALIKGLQDGSI